MPDGYKTRQRERILQFLTENRDRHFHLKCTGCGRLILVECDYLGEVSKHVLEHHQFTIDNTKTVLYGLCADCAAKNQGEPK